MLFLASNQIKDITPLKNLTNLKVLDLKVNQISDLTPLYGLKNLTSLDVVYQKIVETPVTYEPDLVIPVTVKKPDGSLVTPNVLQITEPIYMIILFGTCQLIKKK